MCISQKGCVDLLNLVDDGELGKKTVLGVASDTDRPALDSSGYIRPAVACSRMLQAIHELSRDLGTIGQ